MCLMSLKDSYVRMEAGPKMESAQESEVNMAGDPLIEE